MSRQRDPLTAALEDAAMVGVAAGSEGDVGLVVVAVDGLCAHAASKPSGIAWLRFSCWSM
jgi:hypothetical protein